MSGFDEWHDNFFDVNNCVPCASEAWNEQQKKIDAIVDLVKFETADYDLDKKIQELLKCGKT